MGCVEMRGSGLVERGEEAKEAGEADDVRAELSLAQAQARSRGMGG